MRAATLLILGLLLLAGLVVWLLLPAPAPPAPAGAGRAEGSTAPGETLLVPGSDLIETRSIGAGQAAQDPAQAARVAQAFSFEGEGTIRGHIGSRQGEVFPREWDLILEPHPFLQGRERAETRRIPFRAGEHDFRVEHLKLGGYRVRGEARALNSSSADVLLVRGSLDQFVELGFSPAGWLDGSVVDSQGRPAEGVHVTLVEAQTRARFETDSDGAGAWEFRALLDGDYEISFGAAGRELVRGGSMSFRAPRLTYPQQTLPPTASLRVEVLDRLGQPALHARVTGFDQASGGFDVRTDERGIAVVRWLSPGTWRVSARDDAEGLASHGEVQASAEREAVLALRLLK